PTPGPCCEYGEKSLWNDNVHVLCGRGLANSDHNRTKQECLMQVPPPRRGPLAGLKVLELGHYIAAPFCTRILADLDDQVLKVEPPGADPFRGWGDSVGGHSVWVSVHGRNKLSVVLDLKRDRESALRLAARADVLVENLREGGLERLGLGPEVLQA